MKIKHYRDTQGKFKHERRFPHVIIILLIFISFAYFGNKFVDETTAKLDYAVAEKSNEEKLTENLKNKMIDLNDAKKILDRANNAQQEASELHNIALEDYNVAIDSINLYQGI